MLTDLTLKRSGQSSGQPRQLALDGLIGRDPGLVTPATTHINPAFLPFLPRTLYKLYRQ